MLSRPFIEHLIGYLKAHNIIDIVLAVGKSARQIQDCFDDGDKYGVRLVRSTEGSPPGTAGAVRNAEKFPDDSVIVLNGDIFTDIDLGVMLRLHRGDKAVASLTLTPVEGPIIYGVAETNSEGRIKRFIEKVSRAKVTANMTSADIYILEPGILNYMAPNTSAMFEPDVFPLVLGKGQVVCGRFGITGLI